jgi:hypothetical protein
LVSNIGLKTRVTFLLVEGIGNIVTTNRELTVASAAIGQVLAVDGITLIALLSSVRIVGLSSVVTALAFPVFAGHGGEDFGEEGVIALGTTVEENGNSSTLGSSLVGGDGSVVVEVQLDLKGSVSSTEGVLRGRVEFDSVKGVNLLLPSQGVVNISWDEKVILKTNEVNVKSSERKSQFLILSSSDRSGRNRDRRLLEPGATLGIGWAQ